MIELLLTLWLSLTAPQAAPFTHAPGAAGGERGPGIDTGGVPLGSGSAATAEEDSDLGPMVDPGG